MVKNKKINIFYGDAKWATSLKELINFSTQTIFLDDKFIKIKKKINLDFLVVLHQVHGNQGLLIKNTQQLDKMLLCSKKGDFLITNCKNVGISTLTADCLPLIFWDPVKEVIANAHAGWRGSLKLIAQKVVTAMFNGFGTEAADLQIFFGPCAKACCYEVKEDFIKSIKHDAYAQQSLYKKEEKWFFNTVEYNIFKLQELGIPLSALHFESNHCTLCVPDYCSFRQQKTKSNRNITIVSLK